ncbi:MAG: sodium:solute symporter family protein [Candidatus Latescibacterota bacterium]|nr:sodium:solute symporter family protein [Candidatus Latescibacterota bacterium]
MSGGVSFGSGALVVVGLYLLSMIGIGWLGRRHRKDDSLSDFYLAGRAMGFGVLFLTLYATQYSGNTLFGYTGRSYHIGFAWTVSILFMFSIIVGYLLFAPRLVRVARSHAFITPGDYIQHRFTSRGLTLLATVLMIYALGNYTLAQLKAMGAAVEGITDGAVPSAYGIVALAIIMVIYETLGGMRSVAWTDVIQGVVLLVGFSILLFVIPGLGGGLGSVVEKLSKMEPKMSGVPSLETCNTWISYIFLLGCGAAIYPQAIQRLYAARSVPVLKRSLSVMAFMPLTTTFIALLCGVTGAVVLPGLEGVESDQVLARLCALVMSTSVLGYWLVVVVFAAALAALMSTADSALLSISSMFTRDIYQAHLRPQSSQAELTLVGKVVSWVVVVVLVAIAIVTDKTLVRLLELKFEVLIQIVPCFFLGLYWKRLSTAVVTTGMLVGLVVGLGFTLAGQTRVLGFHAGVVGLFANFGVCALGVWLRPVAEGGNR